MTVREIALAAAGVTMVASAVLASAASAKDEPQVLQPSSNWHLDYAEKYCRLLRTFGEGDEKVVLIMDQSRPGDAFSMTVAGKPMKELRLQAQTRVELQFGPDEESRDVGFLTGDLGSYEPALIFGAMALGRFGPDEEPAETDLPEAEPFDFLARAISMERTRNIEWLEVRRRSKAIRLATGPMDVPIGGMQACLEELASHWGIDVAAHRTLSRGATPANDPGTWIKSRDYPRDAIKSGEQAILNYRITVGEDRTPVECEIVRFTNATQFDEITCKRIKERARFEPALDAQGQPIRSVSFGTIQFQMS